MTLSQEKVQEMDKVMIQDIISNYFEFRSFFTSHTDYKDQKILSEKKALIQKKSKEFYSKYSNHPSVPNDSKAKALVESDFVVFISFKNGSFVYPKSFVRYMDRLNDFNTIPIRPIDLSTLDEYMRNFPLEKGLYSFLDRFFDIIKNLVISLRPREADLLKLFTDQQFLKYTITGKERFYPPQPTEILKVFELTKKSILQISRADNFLYNSRVCYPTSLIMNPAKYGFVFAALDYPNNYPEIVEKLKPYRFWNLTFKDYSTLIVCVPLGNVDELLDEFNYVILENWSWNLSFHNFNPQKYDTMRGWENFKVPNLSKKTRISNYVSWDIIPKRVEYSNTEIKILRKLTSTNIINLKSYDLLAEELSASGTREIVKKFARDDVFQLYPGINHINLQNYVFMRIETKNRELYENIIANLLKFPIVHIINNKNEGLILAYVNLPKEAVSDLIFELKGLKTLFQDIKVEISNFLDPYFVTRVMSLKEIDFTIKNGNAQLKK